MQSLKIATIRLPSFSLAGFLPALRFELKLGSPEGTKITTVLAFRDQTKCRIHSRTGRLRRSSSGETDRSTTGEALSPRLGQPAATSPAPASRHSTFKVERKWFLDCTLFERNRGGLLIEVIHGEAAAS